MDNTKNILSFLHLARGMKTALRFKAIKSIPKDSAADHSWRVGLMTVVVADNLKLKINLERALEIAIIHDIVEAIVGNTDYVLVFKKKISKKDQSSIEKRAIKKISQSLPKTTGTRILKLWNEYEDGKTKEARLVHALNRIESLIHLLEVGHKYYDEPNFIANYADSAVKEFPALAPILKEIKSRLKKEFKKGGIPWKKEYN